MFAIVIRQYLVRRRLRQTIGPSLGRELLFLSGYLILIALAHTIAMVHFEGFAVGDALWLTLTTVTTVGYGDLSATTAAGRWSTILLLYLGGIFILAQAASVFFEYRVDKRERIRAGEWNWGMRDHIVIINVPEVGAHDYLGRFVTEIRNAGATTLSQSSVVILARSFPGEFDDVLRKRDCVFQKGSGNDEAALEAANARAASHLVILAKDDRDPESDIQTFDAIHRVRALNTSGQLTVECVRDENRKRFLEAGADVVMRPTRGYPEMMARSLISPGSETIMEDLFTHEGMVCLRRDVSLQDVVWADLVAALVRSDLGTPIAYLSTSGEIIHPVGSERVKGKAVFLLADQGLAADPSRIDQTLSQVSAGRA